MSKKISNLEKQILSYQRLYDKGTPGASDSVFDTLVVQLRTLSPTSPVLDQLGKPTTSRRVKHEHPMLSLEKTYSEDEVFSWAAKSEFVDYVLAPKYDGVSLSLVYKAGRLVKAVTRGDGVEGDDVTQNAGLIAGIPCELAFESSVTVRGECLIPLAQWSELEEKLKEKAKKGTSNPRNVAAGAVLGKAVNLLVLSRMRFIAFDILRQDMAHGTLTESLKVMKQNGFDVGLYVRTDTDARERFLNNVTDVCERSKKCGYETDGIVIKANRFRDRDEAGATSHHPKWALALKFQGDSAETRLTGVQWQVSRSGTITPVALVEPVVLSGATVERATLHNLGRMETLGCYRGAQILMTRRGGVIPHVEKVLSAGGKKIKVPVECPCCTKPAKRDGDFLRCSDPGQCPDVQRETLLYWCAQTDMMGFGPEVIATLYNDGVVMQPSEFYTLDEDEMKQLFGKGAGPKLVREAALKSKMTPTVFLNALGIDGIGKTQAAAVMEKFHSIEELLEKFNERKGTLTDYEIPGFGPVRMKSLTDFLKTNDLLIHSLLQQVMLEPEKRSTVTSGHFAGKSVVFTGQLADVSRGVAQQQVKALGGSCPSSVTKTLDYLVVGDNASPEQLHKRNKAQAYNEKGAKIRVLTETEYTEMVVDSLRQVEGDQR